MAPDLLVKEKMEERNVSDQDRSPEVVKIDYAPHSLKVAVLLTLIAVLEC